MKQGKPKRRTHECENFVSQLQPDPPLQRAASEMGAAFWRPLQCGDRGRRDPQGTEILMKNFVRVISSRFFLLGGAISFILLGSGSVLITGCLIALIVEIVQFWQQDRRIAGGLVFAAVGILEMALVEAILAIYFQANWAFWCVLLTWILSCWLLPNCMKPATKMTPGKTTNPPSVG